MNINDLGKLLGKPPIISPKPVTATVNLDACARIIAAGAVTKAVVDATVYGTGTYEIGRKPIRTCPCCRMPHPADVSCKELERHDNGGGNYP